MSTTPELEAMARAIFHTLEHSCINRNGGYLSTSWALLTEVERTDRINAARAALMAIREPSENVITTGDYIAFATDSGKATWQAMIDQILSEET